MNPIKIAPSILASDFGRLSDEAKRAEQAGADLLHVDVMDGHFVPNITLGPQGVEAIRKAVSIPLDVHLMISRPDKYAKNFIDAGADYLTIHAEAEHDMKETLSFIRGQKIKAGPAINPDREVALIRDVLGMCDIVLIMSVFPGFGGQKFMPEVLRKVEELSRLKKENNFSYEIEIDGGINLETIIHARKSGIDIAVAGTALFRAKDMREEILKMRT